MGKHRKLKRAKRKKNYGKNITKFHIIPKAIGGSNSGDNISLIPEDIHRNYHNLFDLKIPAEIITYLADYFWNGQWHYVEEAFQNQYKKEGLKWIDA